MLDNWKMFIVNIYQLEARDKVPKLLHLLLTPGLEAAHYRLWMFLTGAQIAYLNILRP